MEIKNENLKQSYDSKFKGPLTSSLKLCFCVLRLLFLAFCLLVSFANAETSSEQLDPTDFLTSHLALTSQDVNTPNITAEALQDVNTPNIIAEALQDVNTPNIIAEASQDVNTPNVPWIPDALLRLWEPLIQLVKFQSGRQEQPQISPANCRITDVNSATEATRPSERKEPLARSAEREVSYLTQWPDTSALIQDDSKKRSQLPQDSLPVAQNSNNHPAHQLWQARISLSYAEEDKRGKNELQRIIEQIRSVEFERREEVPKPVIVVVEPALTTKPNETPSAMEAPQENEVKKIELKLPYEPLKDQTLQMLKSLLQHPERLRNPFELGEILFLSGHLKDAAICYQEALSRSSPDKADPTQKPQQDAKVPDVVLGPRLAGTKTGMFSIRIRAWILFQIGNCLRDDELPTAMKMYRQLIAEYPDSPWADLAKARSKLIDWYQKDNPRALIAENQF